MPHNPLFLFSLLFLLFVAVLTFSQGDVTFPNPSKFTLYSSQRFLLKDYDLLSIGYVYDPARFTAWTLGNNVNNTALIQTQRILIPFVKNPKLCIQYELVQSYPDGNVLQCTTDYFAAPCENRETIFDYLNLFIQYYNGTFSNQDKNFDVFVSDNESHNFWALVEKGNFTEQQWRLLLITLKNPFIQLDFTYTIVMTYNEAIDKNAYHFTFNTTDCSYKPGSSLINNMSSIPSIQDMLKTLNI